MIQYSYDFFVDYVLCNFIFVLRMCDVNAVARIGWCRELAVVIVHIAFGLGVSGRAPFLWFSNNCRENCEQVKSVRQWGTISENDIVIHFGCRIRERSHLVLQLRWRSKFMLCVQCGSDMKILYSIVASKGKLGGSFPLCPQHHCICLQWQPLPDCTLVPIFIEKVGLCNGHDNCDDGSMRHSL